MDTTLDISNYLVHYLYGSNNPKRLVFIPQLVKGSTFVQWFMWISDLSLRVSNVAHTIKRRPHNTHLHGSILLRIQNIILALSQIISNKFLGEILVPDIPPDTSRLFAFGKGRGLTI